MNHNPLISTEWLKKSGNWWISATIILYAELENPIANPCVYDRWRPDLAIPFLLCSFTILSMNDTDKLVHSKEHRTLILTLFLACKSLVYKYVPNIKWPAIFFALFIFLPHHIKLQSIVYTREIWDTMLNAAPAICVCVFTTGRTT